MAREVNLGDTHASCTVWGSVMPLTYPRLQFRLPSPFICAIIVRLRRSYWWGEPGLIEA